MNPISSFTIVTPCLNSETLVRQTAESILNQTAVRSGRVALQYIVCDGASQDGTIKAVREVCGERVEIISEPDQGMYEALAKGLRRATGDVVAYLNAGDYYHPGAFEVVADIFDSADIAWLTGMHYVCNSRGQLTRTLLPHRYRRKAIRRGIYGRFLPVTIQQEATFWSRSLLETVDYEQLSRLKLAGDFYLWSCFAGRSELAVVDTFLGAFVQHAGQQSEARARYAREMDEVRERPRLWDLAVGLADALVWAFATPRMKKLLNRRLLFRWAQDELRWK